MGLAQCCASTPTRRVAESPRSDPFLGFSAEYTLFVRESRVERVSTYEEVIEQAQEAVRDYEIQGAIRGDLVFKVPSSGRQRLSVDPLTIENLRATGVDMGSVEFVYLYRVPGVGLKSAPKLGEF